MTFSAQAEHRIHSTMAKSLSKGRILLCKTMYMLHSATWETSL